MKTYKLVAIAAATLLTIASVNAINYNVPVQPAGAASVRLAHVTNFAPIHVYPSAAELRGMSEEANPAAANAALASAAPAEGGHVGSAFQLVGSALSMSHYSRVPSTGRISKE
jgi:hypothetical protein